MTRYVALLRGINVGGHRKVPMADLRDVVAEAGGRDVATYLASGNVVLAHAARSAAALERRLEAAVADRFGFDVDVLVRSARELGAVVAANPYERDDGAKVVAWFCREPVTAAMFDGLDAAALAPEGLTVGERVVYLDLPFGQARSTLIEAVDRLRLPLTVTARNWNTVLAIHRLLG